MHGRKHNLPVIGASGYLAVVIVAAWLGYVTGAYVSDALGRRRSFLLFSLCSILTVVAYTTLPIRNSLMLVLGAPLGFFVSGTYSGWAPPWPSFTRPPCAAPEWESPRACSVRLSAPNMH